MTVLIDSYCYGPRLQRSRVGITRNQPAAFAPPLPGVHMRMPKRHISCGKNRGEGGMVDATLQIQKKQNFEKLEACTCRRKRISQAVSCLAAVEFLDALARGGSSLMGRE